MAKQLPIDEALGKALLSSRLISADALASAVRHSAETQTPLQDAVVGLGLVDEREAYKTLAAAAGLAYADLRGVQPSPLASRLVPAPVAARHEVLPVSVDDRSIRYATAEPGNGAANRDVSMAAGRSAVAIVASRSDLREALARLAAPGGAPRASGSGPLDRPTPTRRTVLIVDDEATTRTLVRLLLERDGFDVLEATNGREALDLAASRTPDLIVMDLVMPELDGYGAISELRRQPHHAATPIVVVTTEEGPAVEQRVVTLGADDYILKPFEPTVLTSRIKSAFRRQRFGGR
jgi:CheY-like chemotaxis protein